MRAIWRSLFSAKPVTSETDPMKKFLIVGLGNTGPKYTGTRHNIGFQILDELAREHDLTWETKKLGDVSTFRKKGRTFILLKPSTFMNRSGKAVKYWSDKEKIPPENMLVITDDLNIPFGTIRMKGKGSDGGHNGLRDIQATLGTTAYNRFRFGIGSDYSRGRQVDFVLSPWSEEESTMLPERLSQSAKAIESFGLSGIKETMNQFNGK